MDNSQKTPASCVDSIVVRLTFEPFEASFVIGNLRSKCVREIEFIFISYAQLRSQNIIPFSVQNSELNPPWYNSSAIINIITQFSIHNSIYNNIFLLEVSGSSFDSFIYPVKDVFLGILSGILSTFREKHKGRNDSFNFSVICFYVTVCFAIWFCKWPFFRLLAPGQEKIQMEKLRNLLQILISFILKSFFPY